MSKQNQAADAKFDKKNQSNAKAVVGVTPEQGHDPAALAGFPTSSINAAGDGSIQSQAIRLEDPRFRNAQRQAIAQQIGGLQGNGHLQRVLAGVNGNGRGPANGKTNSNGSAKRASVRTSTKESVQTKESDETFEEHPGGGPLTISPTEPRPNGDQTHSGQDVQIQFVSNIQDFLFPPRRLKIQNSLLSSLPIMRQRRRPATNFRQRVYVVRDSGIGLGAGVLVNNLEEFKRRVMRLQNTGDWTLVLAIHGSQERVAAQEGPNWQSNAIFYDATLIDQLFSGDPRWVTWRDSYGPNHLALVSCQISVGFERTLISNLTRHAAGSGSQSPGPTQRAQGLGAGCTPFSYIIELETSSGRRLRTRRQYQRLRTEEQHDHLNNLKQLNRTWGYYGAPPVPDARILDYFFDEAPAASWVIVEVGLEQSNGNMHNTQIPFWNRTTGPHATRYRRLCNQGLGNFRRHRPRVQRPPR